ncbi:hypothetical protein FALCPG4_013130 [Fusarium falciforme]
MVWVSWLILLSSPPPLIQTRVLTFFSLTSNLHLPLLFSALFINPSSASPTSIDFIYAYPRRGSHLNHSFPPSLADSDIPVLSKPRLGARSPANRTYWPQQYPSSRPDRPGSCSVHILN